MASEWNLRHSIYTRHLLVSWCELYGQCRVVSDISAADVSAGCVSCADWSVPCSMPLGWLPANEAARDSSPTSRREDAQDCTMVHRDIWTTCAYILTYVFFAARRQLRNTRQFFAEQKKRYRPQAGEAAKPSFRVCPRGRQPNEAAGAIRSHIHEQIMVQACSCARAPQRRVEVRGSFAIHHTIIDHARTG